MTPEEFKKHGYAAIDWIARYMQDIEGYPVLSQSEPGEIRGKLPTTPPENGEPFENMLADLENLILPGITHWQSPNFFAYFPANTSGPSILGELLTAGLGVQGMSWATSPACTELESHVLDWLVDMLGLPDKFKTTDSGGGVIQDSASSASLCALLTARECATEFKTNQNGVDRPLIAYTSEQTHSSRFTEDSVSNISSPGPSKSSDPPGVILTNFPPIIPVLRIDAMASSCNRIVLGPGDEILETEFSGAIENVF